MTQEIGNRGVELSSELRPGWELRSRRAKFSPDIVGDRIRLSAEREWVLTGNPGVLDDVEEALPAHSERLASQTLLIRFGNAVGRIRVPELGELEVVSGKWGEASFDRMLEDLIEVASDLPFSAGDQPLESYRMSASSSPRVAYQSFVYLRHVLSDKAPRGMRLLPMLDLMVRDPHRRWIRDHRRVPLESMSRVDSESVAALLKAPMHEPKRGMDSLNRPLARLARRLGGQLPQTVMERRVRSDVDTQENRFIKAFLDECLGIALMAERLGTERGGSFGDRLLTEAQRCASSLEKIRRHAIWSEVGDAHRIPTGSTVLRSRRGYRQTFQHWVRLRRVAEFPLQEDRATALLELKDIATLYELWSYFQVVREAEAILGSPIRASRLSTTAMERVAEYEFSVEWEGVRVSYNGRFNRTASRRIRKAYSRPLRPDIVIEDDRDEEPTVHLLDAKFRLRPVDEGESGDDRISFKSVDLHKMHAYRDAIRFAGSACVLYPGTECRWFSAGDGEANNGVGAIPVVPDGNPEELGKVMEDLLRLA